MKYSGFWGYYYLSPYNGDDTPGWYDVDEDFYAVNAYYYYNADRVRHQANASLTKYASGFAGEHNLKFGAEFERSYVKSELGYPGGFYVLAYSGVPYYASIWDGYLKDNINTRFTAFAQDSWSIGSRLTLNPGIRFDRNTGFNKHLDDQVFATNSWSPRIGFALGSRRGSTRLAWSRMLRSGRSRGVRWTSPTTSAAWKRRRRPRRCSATCPCSALAAG